MAFAVLLLVVMKQCCITAGAPLLIEGELPVFVVRPHAPNRDARTVMVRYDTCTVPRLIYIYTVLSVNEYTPFEK